MLNVEAQCRGGRHHKQLIHGTDTKAQVKIKAMSECEPQTNTSYPFTRSIALHTRKGNHRNFEYSFCFVFVNVGMTLALLR